MSPNTVINKHKEESHCATMNIVKFIQTWKTGVISLKNERLWHRFFIYLSAVFPLFGSENADMFSYVFFKECIVKFFIVKYASEKLVSEPFCIQQKSICYMNRLP